MSGQASKVCAHLVALLTVCLGVFAGAQRGEALQIIQIPGVSFVLRCSASDCPPTGSSQVGEEVQGMLANAQGKYFAPVIFPNFTDRVCRFVLWARDNDVNENVEARLMRKLLYTTNAFAAPEVMAEVSSSGANANLRVFSDTTISTPLPTIRFVYYVELEVPTETLEVAAVRIETRPTCP